MGVDEQISKKETLHVCTIQCTTRYLPSQITTVFIQHMTTKVPDLPVVSQLLPSKNKSCVVITLLKSRLYVRNALLLLLLCCYIILFLKFILSFMLWYWQLSQLMLMSCVDLQWSLQVALCSSDKVLLKTKNKRSSRAEIPLLDRATCPRL